MPVFKNKSLPKNVKPNGRVKTVEELSLERRRKEAQREETAPQEQKEPEVPGKKIELTLTQKVGLWLVAILLVLAAAFFFASSYCRVFVFQDGSMEPNLSAGDSYLMNTAAYRVRDPKRGDIIVFRYNSSDTSLHVKRVVALPGETIQIKDGAVLINGEALDSGKYPEVIDPGMAYEPITLDPDQYFVLGDNRNGSEDSRYNSVGNIDKNNIVGKLWLRVLPVTKIRFV
ncbi:MAG: signal peptidase I [Eubacteriales bacterium]|nr:signal peptidase I [Eubacteriales bacterium]